MPAGPSATSALPLEGRSIVVGVTAGIAAFKAIPVVRQLSEMGAEVRVIPTESSLEFVGRATWEALSHNRVTTSVFEDVESVAHVKLGQEADAIVVVPATADFLARARMGRADDLLTASLLVARGAVIMAPAMHTEMWEHPATQENVAVLRSRGARIIEPATGRLTGRDSGKGRLPEPESIVGAVLAHLALGDDPRDLAGRRIVVTAGGTREALDPVRVLTNHSSGKQGMALAQAALARGAEVTVIAASTSVQPPSGATVVHVASAADMAEAVRAHAPGADALVMAAAVSDFTLPCSEFKVKKNSERSTLTLTLEPTEDILATAVRERDFRSSPAVIVGFAAETGDSTASALEHAKAKARRKGADVLVFNDVSANTFGSDMNSIVLLDAQGDTLGQAEGTKYTVAHAILRQVADRLARDNSASSSEAAAGRTARE